MANVSCSVGSRMPVATLECITEYQIRLICTIIILQHGASKTIKTGLCCLN